MNNAEEIKKIFLENTKNHMIEVLQDDGVYRHLHFSHNRSSYYHFSITTFPGHLVITGDMGDYIFQRLPDMFNFFRRDELTINPGYWAEKCQCNNKWTERLKTFSPDLFKDVIQQDVEIFIEDLSKSDQKEFKTMVEEEVLPLAEDGPHTLSEIMNWQYGKEYPFADLWDYEFYEYTHHFLWCLYAIVWGIQQYDKHQSQLETRNH